MPDRAREQASAVADRVAHWRSAGTAVLVIGIDGHGAAGKSTIARHLTELVEAGLLHTDDFFDPDGPRLQPGAGSDQPLARYYDLPRLAAEALVPLRDGQAARFRSTDPFGADRAGALVTVQPAPVVVLEGVGATSADLRDLVDRRVLIDTDEPDRLVRLRARIAAEEWDDEWLAAEDRYLRERRRAGFDLIVSGSSSSEPADRR